MIIAPVFFKGSKWRESLELTSDWVKAYQETGSEYPVAMITTPASVQCVKESLVWPYDIVEVPLPFETSTISLTDLLQVFSYKVLQQPVMTMDMDCVPRRKFAIPEEFYHGMWMGRDPGNRQRHFGVELNSGVVVLNQDLSGPFLECWRSCERPDIDLSLQGECAFSMLWYRINGSLLPREWNWSRMWAIKNEQPFIYHRHGLQKWSTQR